MGKKLYVGNLSFSVDAESLTALFTQFGTVDSAKVITDRDTGRSKGFAFVEMSTEQQASDCIRELAGRDHEGRQLSVSEAKPQEPKTGGFDSRGGGRRSEFGSRY